MLQRKASTSAGERKNARTSSSAADPFVRRVEYQKSKGVETAQVQRAQLASYHPGFYIDAMFIFQQIFALHESDEQDN